MREADHLESALAALCVGGAGRLDLLPQVEVAALRVPPVRADGLQEDQLEAAAASSKCKYT